VNTGASSPSFLSIEEAEARVLGIQTKLHQWAANDHGRRFDDLFNLVCDPAVLLVGWRRVRGNKGARSAGVDGQTAYFIERERGEGSFLAELRADLKARAFAPLPVRERMIPKPGGKKRRLGIPTVASNCTSCRSGWGWWREVGRVGDLLAAGSLDLEAEGHAPAA
jgi:RNA-directed DNA polymerase